MIERRMLQCITCGVETTVRTAVGHGTYQEFAFPCPGCGVEIRLGMEIDQKNVKAGYTKLINAKWIDTLPQGEPDFSVETTVVLDAENLVPIAGKHFSPFLSTFHLPEDPITFGKHQGLRFHVSKNTWPMIEKLMIHENNRNTDLYDKQKEELGYHARYKTWEERTLLTLHILETYGRFFCPKGKAQEDLVRQRINLGEVVSPELIRNLHDYLNNTGKNESLFLEIKDIRKRWAFLYPAVSPIYIVFYWSEGEHSLDRYTLGQKRFEELKTFFVDCFETFCRISLVAAAIEGIIWNNCLKIPTPKKLIRLEDFDIMPNGSKPGILKQMVIGDIFAPYIDSRLRNGIGHHSAHYDVNRDEIGYSHETKNGAKHVLISYIRFCERVVRLYVQIEISSVYVHWAKARAEGITGKIV